MKKIGFIFVLLSVFGFLSGCTIGKNTGQFEKNSENISDSTGEIDEKSITTDSDADIINPSNIDSDMKMDSVSGSRK